MRDNEGKVRIPRPGAERRRNSANELAGGGGAGECGALKAVTPLARLRRLSQKLPPLRSGRGLPQCIARDNVDISTLVLVKAE